MKRKSKCIAVGGISVAIIFVLCWIGSVSNGLEFLMPGICGIYLMALDRTFSGKTATFAYIVSSFLLLLLPGKFTAFSYILLLGYYPILCERLARRHIPCRFLIKLFLLTVVGCSALFGGASFLNLWQNPKFTDYYPLFISAYYILALIYDGFLFLLRCRFQNRWDARIKKILHSA